MLFLIFLYIYYTVNCLSVKDTTSQLSKLVASKQEKRTVNGTPPFTWHKDAGLYESHVKLNFHGKPEMAEIRELFKVYDNNMFAAAWITNCILETSLFGVGPNPSEEQVTLTIKAIGEYHDRNRPYNNSLMTFWPQVYNSSTRFWESAPQNLLDLFDLTNKFPVKPLEAFLKLIGLKDVEHVIEQLLSSKDMFLRAFHIPADFDDTFINIGLGSLLKESNLTGSFNEWKRKNTNLTSAFQALKTYAYRPYSTDRNKRSIDPRTYFYLHDFIQLSDKSLALVPTWVFIIQLSDKSLALVPTWIQTIDEAKIDYYNGVAMPFSINNVDVTVSANVIFGITSGILSGLVEKDVFDDDLQNIYNHTILMISYELSNNFSNRRDLALTYYPSKFECYWFVARTLSLLRRYKEKQTLPFAAMELALERFSAVFNGPVLDDLLSSVQADKLNREYYDDFIGNGDFSLFGKPLNRAEDRLFTTSMAVNLMLDAFTVFSHATKKLQWVESYDRIDMVKSHVDLSVTYLNSYILGNEYKTWNAFFSGSGKNRQSMPFPYPANRVEFFNGTKFKPDKFPSGGPFIVGMEGVVTNQEYTRMLNETHFGQRTPLDFEGFNPPSEPEGFFPFWSSDVYTYATTMLALSKYLNIDDNST